MWLRHAITVAVVATTVGQLGFTSAVDVDRHTHSLAGVLSQHEDQALSAQQEVEVSATGKELVAVPTTLTNVFQKATFRTTLRGQIDRTRPTFNVQTAPQKAFLNLPDGYINFNVYLTLTELSSRLALWSVERWNRVEGAANAGSIVGGQRRGSLRIPRSDVGGLNGKFTRLALISGSNGDHATHSVVMKRECSAVPGCDATLDGIYVGIGPYFAVDSEVTMLGKVKKILEPGLTTRQTQYFDAGVETMWVWTRYWRRNRAQLWQAVDNALRECDAKAMRGPNPRPRCPLFIGGSSMGGFYAGLAAYDLAAIEHNLRGEGVTYPNIYAGPARRIVRVVSFNAPKVGNAAFQQRVDTLTQPLVRIINDGDFVEAFPRKYPVDQGGLVLPTVNYVTEEKVHGKGRATAPGVKYLTDQRVRKMCTTNNVDARSPCHTYDCEKIGSWRRAGWKTITASLVPKVVTLGFFDPIAIEFFKKVQQHFKHHGITKKTVPQLVRMAEAVWKRRNDGARPGCSDAIVSGFGNDDRLLRVWKAHVWNALDCQNNFQAVNSACLAATAP